MGSLALDILDFALRVYLEGPQRSGANGSQIPGSKYQRPVETLTCLRWSWCWSRNWFGWMCCCSQPLCLLVTSCLKTSPFRCWPDFFREKECSKVFVWHYDIVWFVFPDASSCLHVLPCLNTAQAASSAAKELPELSTLLQQLSEQRRQHRWKMPRSVARNDEQVFSDGKL